MVAIGRIDPLKDVHTMLRVAVEVLERLPHATFKYYGPVSPDQAAYGKSCEDLYRGSASTSISSSWAAPATSTARCGKPTCS